MPNEMPQTAKAEDAAERAHSPLAERLRAVAAELDAQASRLRDLPSGTGGQYAASAQAAQRSFAAAVIRHTLDEHVSGS